MTVPCANCGHRLVGEVVEPSYCRRCQRAIALVVDAVASDLVALVLRDMADEAEAAAPARIRRAGHSTARAATG